MTNKLLAAQLRECSPRFGETDPSPDDDKFIEFLGKTFGCDPIQTATAVANSESAHEFVMKLICGPDKPLSDHTLKLINGE